MRRWEKLWNINGLAAAVDISFSRRMSRALANCRVERKTIHLNLKLVEPEERELLPAVLCHEFAHIAASHLYGPFCQPHGREWRELYTRAGFDPDRKLSLKAIDTKGPRSTLSYEHRCLICQNVYLARRPMKRWRCADCCDAGLDGHLVISKRLQ
jgi:predicted SprT family Zn-dependent metalloprotease